MLSVCICKSHVGWSCKYKIMYPLQRVHRLCVCVCVFVGRSLITHACIFTHRKILPFDKITMHGIVIRRTDIYAEEKKDQKKNKQNKHIFSAICRMSECDGGGIISYTYPPKVIECLLFGWCYSDVCNWLKQRNLTSIQHVDRWMTVICIYTANRLISGGAQCKRQRSILLHASNKRTR